MGATNPILSEKQFNYNPELVAKYGNYKDYWSAQIKELRSTSAWTFGKNSYIEMRNKRLEKHIAESEVLIERYQQFEKIYKAMKNQQAYLENNLCSKYDVGSSKDLALAMKDQNSLTDQGKFNVAARNTDEARINYEVALSIALDQTHQIV